VLGEFYTHRTLLSQREKIMFSLFLILEWYWVAFLLVHIAREGFMLTCTWPFHILWMWVFFSAAQCIDVSQLIYDFESDLKRSRCLFSLSIGAGIVEPPTSAKWWELNSESCTFWAYTLTTVLYPQSHICLWLELFCLFTISFLTWQTIQNLYPPTFFINIVCIVIPCLLFQYYR
jgi:hypothetical protein